MPGLLGTSAGLPRLLDLGGEVNLLLDFEVVAASFEVSRRAGVGLEVAGAGAGEDLRLPRLEDHVNSII